MHDWYIDELSCGSLVVPGPRWLCDNTITHISCTRYFDDEIIMQKKRLVNRHPVSGPEKIRNERSQFGEEKVEKQDGKK
jgi:hypothetical protein